MPTPRKKPRPTRRGIKLTPVDPNLVDLREWDLETVKRFAAQFEERALEAASEALRIAVREYPADAWFPIAIMNRASIKREIAQGHDVMEFHITLPLGRGEETDNPTWKVSLDKVIYEETDSYVLFDCDPHKALALTTLRDGFLTLAAKIDKTLIDHPPEPFDED